jgi:hypothetical protein
MPGKGSYDGYSSASILKFCLNGSSLPTVYSSEWKTFATDSQSVSQSVSLLLLFDSYGLVFVGRPLWWEDGSIFCICYWSLPAQPFGFEFLGTRFSDLRLPFSLPPTTCRVMVEVFDPAFTLILCILTLVILFITPQHGPPQKTPFPAVPLLLCSDCFLGNPFVCNRCLEMGLPATVSRL